MDVLRQSTAAQSVCIGPFIDDTDFKTPETALTIANTDIKLSKNGSASSNKNSGGATHRVNGVYSITLDATDTNTVGELDVSVQVAGALIVKRVFRVVSQSVYDALFDAASSIDNSSQVADEFITKLGTETVDEPAGGTPPAEPTFTALLGYLYKFLRNRRTFNKNTLVENIYNSNGSTIDHTRTINDDDTTYEKGPIVSGP